MRDELLRLMVAREGHFRLESGYHTNLWFDLDVLFKEPGRLKSLTESLAELIRPSGPDAICGPLVGGAFLAQAIAAILDVEFYYTERFIPSDAGEMYSARYHLPKAMRAHVSGKTVAIVDDVISAGSAVGGTFNELVEHGARPQCVASYMVLGPVGKSFFADRKIPVLSLAEQDFQLWKPESCPLCEAHTELEVPGSPV